MKELFEKWQNFLNEDRPLAINSLDKVIEIIRNNPQQTINIDKPKGNTKKFGGEKEFSLPFHYGEYTHLINPADGMGWDLAIVPSAKESEDSLLPEEPLIPVGYAKYSADQGQKIGNDKIIVAPNGVIKGTDKNEVEDFFTSVGFFDPVVWF